MSDIKLQDLGMAEFVAGLISETFEAITSSVEDQVKRESELRTAVVLTPQQFRKQFFTDETILQQMVDDALIQLFGVTADGKNSIQPNAFYRPETNVDTELPALYEALQITLEEGKEKDFMEAESGEYQFTSQGVNKIREAVINKEVAMQQDTLRQLLNRGFPRILVDSGKILSKVSFSLVTNEAEKPESPAISPTGKAIFASRLQVASRLGLPKRSNLVNPSLQFKIKTADATADSIQTSTTNLYGEVEIHFKTVF